VNILKKYTEKGRKIHNALSNNQYVKAFVEDSYMQQRLFFYCAFLLRNAFATPCKQMRA
jgi:hypothetical protein